MTVVTEDAPSENTKTSKAPLIIGLVLALLGAGGGFFAVSAGLLFGKSAQNEGEAAHSTENAVDDLAAPVAFLPLDPLVISLPGDQRFLRFTAQLEVAPSAKAEVEAVRPRIVDVVNGYLRAVDIGELADPAALIRLRGQLLRRVQIVAGADNVLDLLIMEFVLN